MTSILTTETLLIVGIAAVFSWAMYHIFKTDKQLATFRSNLKPGDYALIERNREFIRAKFMKRHPRDNRLFVFKVVNSNKALVTEIHNIYRA